MFDRVVVIEHPDRPERLRAFYDGLPDPLPFPRPIRSPGVSGRRCRPAGWWRNTAAAWGAYRAHHHAIEQALTDGVESLLVFEDDATFLPDLADRMRATMADLPDDAAMIYLGGQHLREAIYLEGRRHVVSCRNVNRAHAYGLMGPGIAKAYEWLHPGDHWPVIHHVDHAYGRLHESGLIPCYASRKWLVGQRAGYSDTDQAQQPERWWRDSRMGGE
jgi:hypothetical protein